MILPTTPTGATNVNPEILLLYGPAKVGKTTFLSQNKKCLLIDLESGSTYVDALKIQVKNMTELDALCTKIEEAGKPYEYIALDTITKLEELCENSATLAYMNTPMGKTFNRKKGTPKYLPLDQWTSV